MSIAICEYPYSTPNNAGCTATYNSCATSLVTSPEGVNTSTSSAWLDFNFLTLFSSFFRSGLVQSLFYLQWFFRISFVNPSCQPQSKPHQVNFQGIPEREPPFARMSTGVDGRFSQGLPSHLTPNSNTRIRSNSRTNYLATSYPDESDSSPGHLAPPTMAQTQKARYLKTGAILTVLLLMLFYLSPSRPSVGSFRGMLHLSLWKIDLVLTESSG